MTRRDFTPLYAQTPKSPNTQTYNLIPDFRDDLP